MIPDRHNACPACNADWRALYAVARRVLAGSRSHFFAHERLTPPEYEELYLACERVRDYVEAHHANQDHAFSPELEAARHPVVPVAAVEDKAVEP
jgi:hypothetical protein